MNNAVIINTCLHKQPLRQATPDGYVIGLAFLSRFNIQDVSRIVDITAAGHFLGLCDQKVHINVCPILDDYGVKGIF